MTPMPSSTKSTRYTRHKPTGTVEVDIPLPVALIVFVAPLTNVVALAGNGHEPVPAAEYTATSYPAGSGHPTFEPTSKRYGCSPVFGVIVKEVSAGITLPPP